MNELAESIRFLQAQLRTLSLKRGFHDAGMDKAIEEAQRHYADNGNLDEAERIIEQGPDGWSAVSGAATEDLQAAADIGEQHGLDLLNCLILAESLNSRPEVFEPYIAKANAELEQLIIKVRASERGDQEPIDVWRTITTRAAANIFGFKSIRRINQVINSARTDKPSPQLEYIQSSETFGYVKVNFSHPATKEAEEKRSKSEASRK